MSEKETAWTEDDMHELAGFLLDYMYAYETYREAVTKRVHLWERSTSAVFDVVKQIMQVSEKNAAMVMKNLTNVNDYLMNFVGLQGQALVQAIETIPPPKITERLERVNIAAFREQLVVDEAEGKPVNLDTQGMKKFIKYMA